MFCLLLKYYIVRITCVLNNYRYPGFQLRNILPPTKYILLNQVENRIRFHILFYNV